MLKKRLVIVSLFLLVMVFMVAIGEAKSTVPQFFINGKKVLVGKITPLVINGEPFFSIQDLEKILGLKIKWNASSNEFTIENSTSIIVNNPATMTISTTATQGMILKIAVAKAMPLKLLWWKESSTTIDGPYGDNSFHIYSAQPGMKFVMLVFKITNDWVESQDTPLIIGYIKTNKGFYYKEWSSTSDNYYNYKTATQREINEFLGEYNGYKDTLLPGQSTKKWLTFEIPKDEKPTEIVFRNIDARVILKGAL